MSNHNEIAADIAANPYAWPGGYTRYALMEDGDALCAHCCAVESDSIASATPGSGWVVIGAAINWEDADLYCCHCGAAIPPSYGE